MAPWDDNDEESGENTAQASDALGADINITGLEEANSEILTPFLCSEALASWNEFLARMDKEAANEALYSAVFEGIPSMQEFFTTGRQVQAERLMQALTHIVHHATESPSALFASAEAIGFSHLNFEITQAKAANFRDAVMLLLENELGDAFGLAAREGWTLILNYVLGAIIFVRLNYLARLKLLVDSWNEANKKKHKEAAENVQDAEETSERGNDSMVAVQDVPTDFGGMFQFNLMVMNKEASWMEEVLDVFDAMVRNVGVTGRLNQECSILAIKLARRWSHTNIVLANFKPCMLASLRSLLPRIWDSNYEVAWNWLWDQVERQLKLAMPKPKRYEESLRRFYPSFSQEQRVELRKVVWERYFQTTPVSQDFFLQSDTRIQFISERIMTMLNELYEDPWAMVDEISSIGLRHVAYGIATDLVQPFIQVWFEVVEEWFPTDKAVFEALRWTLALISEMLVKTIEEGSTIVMKAVNANSAKQLRKAASCAPRGERTTWFLKIQVGSQSISPLTWAIESGSLAAAEAIIFDLLTIRADRERYYYGVDELFQRHPDIVHQMAVNGKALLPVFLEGLVWRSRQVADGQRRANYYIEHLVIKEDGSFADCLENIAQLDDPELVCHPILAQLTEALWEGVVRKEFVASKLWLFISLALFITVETGMGKVGADYTTSKIMQVIIVVGRCAIYVFTMPQLIHDSVKQSVKSFREGKVTWIGVVPLPDYVFGDFTNVVSALLAVFLMVMCAIEPYFYCIGDQHFPTAVCQGSAKVYNPYAVCACVANALFFLALVDLAVLSTGLCAFVLVMGEVMGQVLYFVMAFAFVLLTFGSGISALQQSYWPMQDLGTTLTSLYACALSYYQDDYRDFSLDPCLLVVLFTFIFFMRVLLLNVLIAQVNQAYVIIYNNMIGFARLRRSEVIISFLRIYPKHRWDAFVNSLGMKVRLEFNEGDVGLAGGIRVIEAAKDHEVSRDRIMRYGGSCSFELPWPDEGHLQDKQKNVTEEEKLIRLEGSLRKLLKQIDSKSSKRKRDAGGSGMSGSKGSSGISGGSFDSDVSA